MYFSDAQVANCLIFRVPCSKCQEHRNRKWVSLFQAHCSLWVGKRWLYNLLPLVPLRTMGVQGLAGAEGQAPLLVPRKRSGNGCP